MAFRTALRTWIVVVAAVWVVGVDSHGGMAQVLVGNYRGQPVLFRDNRQPGDSPHRLRAEEIGFGFVLSHRGERASRGADRT